MTSKSIQIKDEETVALVEQERQHRGDLDLATTARSILRSVLRPAAKPAPRKLRKTMNAAT